MALLPVLIVIACWLGGNTAQTPDPCPPGYEHGHEGQCFAFLSSAQNRTTWGEAREACRRGDPDSDLVVISSPEKLRYVQEQITDGIWWIGFSDLSQEGTWKWVDCNESTPWQQLLWGTNQPGGEGEDCGAYQQATNQTADYGCDRQYGFICEIAPRAFGVEDTNVRGVDARQSTETAIRVTWESSSFGCDITGYRVYYQQYGDPNLNGSVGVSGGNETGVTVTDLATNTMWQVYAAAVHAQNGELDRVGPVNVWIGSCPEWHLPGPSPGSCYWFYHAEGGQNWWYTQRGRCRDRGSELAIIGSREEMDYVLNRTETLAPGQAWWIGYSDISVEGDWRWLDCSNTSEWQSALWAPGEPAESDDCATLQGDTGLLSGRSCDQKFFFVCEVTQKDFTEADTNARNVLATAVNETAVQVTWDPSPYNCDIFGYRVYYQQYREPSNAGSVHVYGGDAGRVVIQSLTKDIWWEFYVAALQVERELDKVGPDYVWLGSCPGWHTPGPNGSCYWFNDDVNDQDWWYAGRSNCARYGSDLVVINNQEELEYIRNQTETLDPDQLWWIGYSDVSTEGSWRWVDCNATNGWQSALDIWAPGEPNASGDCATLEGSTGQMYGQVCDRKFSFICEVSQRDFTKADANVRNVRAEAVNETTLEVTWDVSPYNCEVFGYRVFYEQYQEPSNTGWVQVFDGNATSVILSSLATNVWWEIYVAALHVEEELPKVGPAEVWLGSCPEWHQSGPNGSCYWFYHNPNSTGWWYNRRGSCQDRGSDLLIINSPEELDYILNQTESTAPGQSWWIGYYDVSVEGAWKWVDCSDTSDWQATLWAAGEPAEADDCATLRGDTGQLHGQICDRKMNFICEASPKNFTEDDTRPTDVTAAAVTSSSVEVTWTVSRYACDIFAYRVHYSSVSDPGLDDSVTVYGGNVSTALLDGLRMDTEYSIGVAALNLQEEMEEVGPVLVTTPWGCPGGYEEGPGERSCYAFSDVAKPWGVARWDCEEVADGDLAVLDSQEEVEFVMKRLGEVNPGQTAWIGYGDISVEGLWQWVDCQPTYGWQEALWPADKPRVGTEDCAYIGPRAAGNDSEIGTAVCDVMHFFVCEVTEKGFLPEDGNARNVRASPLTPARIRVTWDVSPNNCDVIGYSIYYSKEADPTQEDSVTVYGGDVGTVEIRVAEVTEETVYLVSVTGLDWQRALDRVGPARVTLTPESGNSELIEVEADEGTLTSPGWPTSYENDQDITWTITVTKPGRVLLTVQSVRLDSSDSLSVGAGADSGANELERYTGYLEGAGTLESATNQMWMRFRTDGAITAQGFLVQFARREGDEGSDCGAEFSNVPSGTVTSPNYPDQPYPANADCLWLITLADDTARVQLDFTAFDLEDGHDFLVIGYGLTANENTLLWLTGKLEAPSVLSPTHEMWLRLVSDESVAGPGFRAGFSSLAGPPLPTPEYNTENILVIVVHDQNVGWFSSLNRIQLASTIAEVLNRQVAAGKRTSRAQAEFNTADVVFVKYYNVGSDLYVETWVRDATSPDPGQALDPARVTEAIDAESAYFQEAMGPSFEYSLQSAVPPTEVPGDGLSQWAIAVIAVAALLVLVFGGLVIFGCAKTGSDKNEQVRSAGNDYVTYEPSQYSSAGNWNPTFQAGEAPDTQEVTPL